VRFNSRQQQSSGLQWQDEQQHHGPAVLAVGAVAATVIGAGVTAYSAESSAAAQAQAANYQAQVARNNQTIANNNADAATAAGAAQEQQNAMKTRAEVGAQLADQASSGLDVNSGSAVDVRSSTSALGELSGLNIVNNAARTAYGYKTQSENFGAQANLDTMEASSASLAGDLGAAGSIIGGIGSASSLQDELKLTGAYNQPVKLSF
jgi:hypothetical protein